MRSFNKKTSQELDIADIASILLRRLMTIALTMFMFVTPAVLYIMFSPKLYNATTSLLVDPRQGRSLSQDVAGNNLSSDTAQMESQLKLVSSQTVLRRVVEREKLLNDPEFGVSPPGILSRILAVVGRSVDQPSMKDKMAVSVDALSKAISVKRPERTYIIDIQVASQEAEKSARIANSVSAAYMDDSVDARNQAVKFESDWLRERLTNLQAKLQEAEARVEAYKEQNKIFDANGKLVNDDQITNLSNEIVLARTRTAEARAKFEQMQKAVRSGSGVAALGEAQKSTVLEKLRSQAAEINRLEANLRTTLGPRHPQLLEVQQQAADTRALISEELRRIAKTTENEFQVARAGEASLERELERLKVISGTTNLSRPQLRELEREVEAQRSAFERFSKIRDAISQQGGDAPIGRVIAPAVAPDAPTSPRKIPILALALAAGMGFGIALALLRESMAKKALAKRASGASDTFRSSDNRKAMPLSSNTAKSAWNWRFWQRGRPEREREAKYNSRNTAAGIQQDHFIPAFDPFPLNPSLTQVRDEPETAFSLAVFQLCSRIILAAGARNPAHRGPVFVLVTSKKTNVGATTLVANMAHAAIASGARTLLIDGNTGNPTLSFHATNEGQPGLMSAMGRKRLAFAMYGISARRLVILPASEGTSAAARRLPKMLPELMAGDIDSNFDIVIIDGGCMGMNPSLPPLAAEADIVLLVGADEMVSPGEVEAAAVSLAIDRSKIFGVTVDRPRRSMAA